MRQQRRSPKKFEGKGKNTQIKTTVRTDLRHVEQTDDGEVISASTLEEQRVINKSVTRAHNIDLEFRNCKQFLLNWINRQHCIYGCQMHLWDDDILKALAAKQRNCMIAVPITDWMTALPQDLQGQEAKWREVVESWYPRISCSSEQLPESPGVSYTQTIEDCLKEAQRLSNTATSQTKAFNTEHLHLTLKGQTTYPEFDALLRKLCHDNNQYQARFPGIILVKGSHQTSKELGLMHHKFFIGYGHPFAHNSKDELSLIVGTFNCSWGAGNNLESLMIFRREDYREIIDAYRTEFFGIICSQELAWGYWPLA